MQKGTLPIRSHHQNAVCRATFPGGQAGEWGIHVVAVAPHALTANRNGCWRSANVITTHKPDLWDGSQVDNYINFGCFDDQMTFMSMLRKRGGGVSSHRELCAADMSPSPSLNSGVV